MQSFFYAKNNKKLLTYACMHAILYIEHRGRRKKKKIKGGVKMKRKVMMRAVKLAKKFEGDWQARMSMALKISWGLERKETLTVVTESNANEWKKYGHHRIYVTGKMVVYVDAWGTIKTREKNFSGYYDLNKNRAVKQAGDSDFKEEIFEAIKYVKNNFTPAKKDNVIRGFFQAKFPGRDAETGEKFDVGDYIFYCPANGGYCLLHNA